MSTYISSRPGFYFTQLLGGKKNHINIFPMNQKDCFYFFSARYALTAGIKALGIKSGDAILLPSYNCGPEVDSVTHSNLKPIFYKVGRNHVTDLDDLSNKISNQVKAIFVTHFLGFPQPIEEIKRICVERSLFLIEDCAHAFLSKSGEKSLGSYGDISVFSLLKPLPIPNGGVLVINNTDVRYEHNPKRPSSFSAIFYISELLKMRTLSNAGSVGEDLLKTFYSGTHFSLGVVKLFLAAFRKIFHPNGLYLVRPDSYLFRDDLSSWGMSALSRYIIRKTDFEKIKNIKRKNFQYLLHHFIKNERVVLPFNHLPPGVCPSIFPILLERAETREKLHRMLGSMGIRTHIWWNGFHPGVPWDEFPDAVYLKRYLFGLPIHQDLTIKHLDQIIESFEEVYERI
jgi:perosamine synthetase